MTKTSDVIFWNVKRCLAKIRRLINPPPEKSLFFFWTGGGLINLRIEVYMIFSRYVGTILGHGLDPSIFSSPEIVFGKFVKLKLFKKF